MSERTKDMVKVGESVVRDSGGSIVTSFPKQLEFKAGDKLIFWRNSKSGKDAVVEHIPAEEQE